jgi:surface polysaccharide O-acyltransferase-like enzyme
LAQTLNQQNSKKTYISMINVIAAVSVVILHANVSFWLDVSKPYWDLANVIESVFYFAVPVFFMMSGATLIDYRDRCSTKEYFAKRIKKTVIPFLAWSVVGLLWAYRKVLWAMLTGQPNNGLDWTFQSVFDGILNTRFRDIYNFFIPLFCVYLIIPLLAAVRKDKRIKVFTYIIGVSLAVNYVIPFLFSMLNHYAEISFGWPYKIYVGFEYLYYVLVGYVISKREIRLKFRLIIYAAALAGLMATILGTYFETKAANGVISPLYKGYYNLPCVLYSTGIFLFLKQAGMRIKNQKTAKVFSFLQSYTFAIYLIHRYYLDVFEENLQLIHMERASLLYVVLATVSALILSILTTMLLRKIPVLRRIVP